ncbi:MFS transporter [Brucella haematophila]|uniref:MFS transporter n=2 Tax=Brucella haematophila TaxID=419474 RepID=A0ABX1DQP6_9HYPH|nr:MFS transporter [Brucella haematophila]TMV02105.1 MFS transporter [Brucella haematophila]
MSNDQIHVSSGERSGFAIALVSQFVMMASASLPSPFYPALQQEIGFSPAAMTGIFAIYAGALLTTLLVAGASSDYIGRRPVLSLGFLLLALSAFAFMTATSLAGLLVARCVQGVACGLLITASSATVVDFEPRKFPGIAAICNSVVPLLGLAAGAVIAGLIMDMFEQPRSYAFGGLIFVSLVLAVMIWTLPESSPRHRGILTSLQPRLGLPSSVRNMFWKCAPAVVAAWATGGFYLALGPLIMSKIFNFHDYLAQASVITFLSIGGAIASYVARKFAPRNTMLYGTSSLAVGTIFTLVGILSSNITVYLIALFIAGTGFGTCFYASLRSIVPLTPVSERGEVFASIFTLSYLAFGMPVVVAGIAMPYLGLQTTLLIYGLAIALMAAIAGALRKADRLEKACPSPVLGK